MTAVLPPTPFRPWPIRTANAVGRGLERVGRRPVSLAPESMLRAATRATRLDDFGPASFRPGLARLVQSLEEDAELNLFGRFMARRQIVELLEQRLRLVDWRNREPGIAAGPTERPLFVLGLPRTGTTLLYGLLAEDTAARAPMSWEVDQPDPPPEAETFATDPRIASSEKRFGYVRQLAPGFQAIHPIGALMPQECIVMMAPEFMSMRFEMTFGVWGYQQWMLEQDMGDAYRFHRSFLQHLQWRGPKGRWVLKSPGHLGTLETLLEVYPDAMIVQTHRDPVRVMPSVASLEVTMRQASSDAVDPERVGRENLTQWSAMLDRCIETRAQRPDIDARILDLAYDDVVGDPMGTVGRIYDHFDLTLDGESEARMKRYLADNPRHRHGTHSYLPETFGLDEAGLDRKFADYRARFDVRAEPFER